MKRVKPKAKFMATGVLIYLLRQHMHLSIKMSYFSVLIFANSSFWESSEKISQLLCSRLSTFSYTRLEESVDKIFLTKKKNLLDWQLNSEIMASHLTSTPPREYKTVLFKLIGLKKLTQKQ